mgnify:CR=1 FL=1
MTAPRRAAGGKAIKRITAYRSGLEAKLAAQLASIGVEVLYEDKGSVIKYETPAENHRYTPDFVLPNGIVIESKGIFDSADRKKHLLIRAHHPDIDIRFVFSRSKAPIYKGSPTSYAAWCAKHGFQYTDRLIPPAWLDEPRKENT